MDRGAGLVAGGFREVDAPDQVQLPTHRSTPKEAPVKRQHVNRHPHDSLLAFCFGFTTIHLDASQEGARRKRMAVAVPKRPNLDTERSKHIMPML